MKKIMTGALFVAVVVMTSCGGSDKKTGDNDLELRAKNAYNDLLKAHDIGMEDWMRIEGRLKKLQQWWDSASKVPDAVANNLKGKFEETKEALNKAYAEMDSWMPTINLDSAKDNLEQRIQYLTWEKNNAEKVNKSLAASIRKTDSLLQAKGQ